MEGEGTVETVIFATNGELCKDDCEGLCAKCGKNLNEGECSCDTRETDPRFDVLDKFFE